MSEMTERPAAQLPCEGVRVELASRGVGCGQTKPGMITHHISKSGFGVKDHAPEDIRAAIYAVEGAFAAMNTWDVPPAEHMFVPGLYFRRFDMAENTYLTGKLHAQDDGLIVAQGTVTIHTEHGSRTIEGPCMTTVKANTKPLIYAHTPVVVFSAHLNPDDTQDMDLIESRVIIPNVLGVQNKETLR